MNPAAITFTERVVEYLADGFGAEDIAIFLKCTPERVRREVKALRQADRLEGLYR